MKKKSNVLNDGTTNCRFKKRGFISMFFCCIAALSVITGCEKASERTIYITPIDDKISEGNSTADAPDDEASEEAEKVDFSEKAESIGAEKLLETMTFKFDGIKMCLDKKPYSDFKEKGWVFDPAAYGLENLTAEIGSIYQRSIFLDKTGYDQGVFCIGVTNFKPSPCGIEEIQLWSVEFTAHEKNKYPEIIVNGGITWGSKTEDIIKAYGEPNVTERNDIDKSSIMHYTDNSGSDVYFEVYDDTGVGKITLEMYKP